MLGLYRGMPLGAISNRGGWKVFGALRARLKKHLVILA